MNTEISKEIKSREFENKLLSKSCLIIMAGMAMAVVFNTVMKLDFWLIVTTVAAFFVFLFLYYLSKDKRNLLLVKWIISVLSLILINLAWLTNYGSKGPTFFLVIIYLTYIIFIWQKPIVYYFLVVILFNLSLTLFIELKWHEILSSYSSSQAQTIDLYLGLLISTSLITLFSFSLKRYFKDQSDVIVQSDRQKSQLLSHISHRIRTPLNAIVGFSELIGDDHISTQEKQDYKESIWENSKILTGIIENVIDLSVIENNSFKPNFHTFNLIRVLDRVVESARKRKNWMGKRNLEINYEKVLFNVLVTSDETRMERILNNLLNHAIERSLKGEVQVRCKLENNRVYVYIDDTGPQFNANEQLMVFDRYNGLKNQETSNAQSAIDLYLSYEVLSKLGGELAIQPGAKQGSTFYFWLPVYNS